MEFSRDKRDNPESRSPYLSIILPVFNEEEVIILMLTELEEVASRLNFVTEIIVVNDGSTDLTDALVSEYQPTNFHLRRIAMIGNQGHMMALTAGMEAANGSWIASMDSDFQDPPPVLLELVEYAMSGKYDVIQAVRKSRNLDSFFKKKSASFFYKWMNFLLPHKTVNEGADFRIIHKSVRDLMISLPERSRIYRLLIPSFGLNLKIVEFDRDSRKAGQSKYPMRKMIALGLDSTFSFSAKPLRFLFVAGTLSSIVLLIVGLVVLILKFYVNSISGWTSIVMLMLLLNSVVIAGIGLVGEYVGRIYKEIQRRPFALWEELRD